MASDVSSFLVDAAGDVVAFEPVAGTADGTLVWFEPGSSTSEAVPIVGFCNYFAEDGSGFVVALIFVDAYNVTVGSLWMFSPESKIWQEMNGKVSTFLVDAAGSVVAFEPTGSNDGILVRFAPGSTTAEPMADNDTFAQIELDASGSIVALDTSGNLVRFAPAARHRSR